MVEITGRHIDTMKKGLIFCVCAVSSALAGAQDLVISNGRVIDGAGRVLPQGSVVINNGRISSVSAGSATGTGVEIDAAGMTVMPAFTDTHRHVIRLEPPHNAEKMAAWFDEQSIDRMYEYLEAGFTTIMSAGDYTDAIVELRRRLQDGEITGPRLFASGWRIQTPPPGELEKCIADAFCSANNSYIMSPVEGRAKVRELVDAGVDVVKIRYDSADPNGITLEMLAAIMDEADQQGVPAIVHVTEVNDMMETVELGAERLVHTPHTGTLAGTKGPELVYESGIPVSSTLGVWVPMFLEDNIPRFRNGSPFPPPGIARAGQGPVNARYLWNEGVPIAFGTDTPFMPVDALAHELRPLGMLFSPADIVVMLTKNAAEYMDLGDKLGTLEPGKIADIVIVDGDPLTDSSALLDVVVVVMDGEIVVDNRQ